MLVKEAIDNGARRVKLVKKSAYQNERCNAGVKKAVRISGPWPSVLHQPIN